MPLGAALTALVLGVATVACRDPIVPPYVPPAIQASAAVTGLVTGPNGHGVAAQLVYVYSDFTTSCGSSPTLLGFARTDGAGVYRFNRVVAPTEAQGVCVGVVVRPEARTGLAESAYLAGFVDFRLLPPLDTAQIDVALTP